MEIEKSSTVTKDNFPAADFATARQSKSAETKVEVAVRVRPFISKEILNRDEKCVQTFRETNQILMGKDRTFNFDKVFDENSRQDQVYEECAKDLVLSCLAGYNTTILAYGQTGSGKTHTMGSSATYHLNHGDTGIIPRVMKEIFLEIEKRAQKSEFIVRVSFLEIYNEEIQDLLDNTNSRLKINSNLINKNPISIREEKDGSISVYGIVEEKVSSYEEMAACLERGSLNRATASTLMNETSSRSHAIFTISIEQHQIEDLYKDESAEKKNSKQPDDGGFTTAKFHFVDLAGSERVKRTGASGSILREGININRGLLALGNVISALTDDTGKVSHVPYRESKLTRMLQDSLGGNSRTVMIACISPAESNFDESLNTLKYASRARNIRNKPIINRDPQSTLISQLKQQVFELQNELLACRRMFGANLKENNMSDHMYGSASKIFAGNLASSREENALKDEVKTLKLKLFQSEKEMVKVSNELKEVKNALNKSEISLYSIQKERDLLKVIQEKYKKFIEDNGMHFNLLDDSQLIEVEGKDIMEEYTQKIENLKQELKDKERANIDLQQDYEILIKSSAKDQKLLLEKTKTIQFLTSQLKKEKALVKRLQQQGNEVEANKSPNGMGVEQSNEGDLKIEEVMESEEEGNEEDEMLDREYEVNTQATREEMMLVDGTLTEKEELLENITQNQMLLEKNLAEEMKNQYYSKILELEDEIKLLERKRDDTISKMNVGQQHNDNEKNKVITTYKHKISELETSLKDYKKKEREQQSLLKLVNNQRAKIDQLDGEINKIKTQKNLLQKRMREEAERFEKLKNTRQRELMEVKKKNIEKDAMITKLRSENKRKDLMYKKKAEELLARCMSKELMRHIGRGGNNGVNNHNLSTPRMSSSKKKTNAANRGLMSNATNSAVQENNKLEVEETGGLEVVQEHDVRQLVDFCTEQLLEHLKLSYEIEKEGENLRKTEEELEIERNKYSHILLTRDKLEIEKREAANDLELEQSLATKIQEHELELNEIFTRVENLEEKVEFQTGKLKSLTDQLSAKPLVNVEELLINNNRISHNPLNYQMILRCLFGKHIGSNLEIVKLQEKLNNFVNTVAELNKKIDDIQQRARFSELQYEINLTKLTKEYEKNQLLLIKQQDYTEDDEEGSDPDKEVTMGTETVDKNALNFNLLQKSTSDVANSNRQYLAGRGQSVLQQTRHRRAHSGADGSHSRGNSVKMVESPTRKSVKDGDLGKKGEKNEQVKKLEKTISEMNKKQQSSDKVIETLKRKCEVLQAKYDQFKKQTAKEKFIGLQKDDPLLGSLNTTTSNFSLLNENLNGEMIKGSPFATVSTANENININGQSFKNPLDVINSLNLLNFKDKRKEEKQRNRYGRQNQQNDSMQPPTIDTSLGDISMKKKVPGFTVSTNANASNHRNLAINANISQVLRNSSTLPSMKKAYSPFQDIEEKMYLEPNPKEYGSARNIYEPGEGDFMVEDFLVSEKENISDKAFDDALAKSMDYNNKNWRCCLGIDTGHSGGVYSMVSHGNMLYTAGNKTIKLWSLDRMSYITELNAHTSSIKSMAVWADRNLLVSACDKAISLWDLTTLQSIATLKGHKDEIKALHIANNLLISAGKGSLSHGAILTWDLRSLGPTDEKEKNQEVFCMASNNGVLYYGSRNHQVRRVNLLTMESLPPFEPPHYDAVTSLTIVKDNLVSGSRDKNLRLWGLDQTQQNLRHTSYAHQDWINVIESNNARNLVYSGSRDGTIKIWNIINNKKLRCLSDINGHSQSVTSICQVYDENEAMFVTASLDKTIKIWKPMPEDTLAETNAQNTVKANHTSPGFKQYKTNQQGFDISPTNNDNSSPPSSIDKDKDLMI